MVAVRQDRHERQQDRAAAKAVEQAMAGNRPIRLSAHSAGQTTREQWSVGSRTTGGTRYLVELVSEPAGISTQCACQAGEAAAECWHRMAVLMARGGELECVVIERPEPVAKLTGTLTNDDLFGPRRSGR